MTIRYLFFILVCVSGSFAPVWLYILLAFLYALRYTAYELIVLATIFDAYYGMQTVFLIPVYTLGVTFGLLLLEWVKPHISVYNQ